MTLLAQRIMCTSLDIPPHSPQLAFLPSLIFFLYPPCLSWAWFCSYAMWSLRKIPVTPVDSTTLYKMTALKILSLFLTALLIYVFGYQ